MKITDGMIGIGIHGCQVPGKSRRRITHVKALVASSRGLIDHHKFGVFHGKDLVAILGKW